MLQISFNADSNSTTNAESMALAQTRINEIMSTDYIQKLRQLNEVKKQLEEIEANCKAELQAVCTELSIDSIKNDEEGFSIVNVAPTVAHKKELDVDKLQALLETFGENINEYYVDKETKRNGYIKLAFKENK